MNQNTVTNTYCLITGGSHGIGRAMAVECAKRGMNLILAALPGPELEEACQFIRMNYHVQAHPYPVDLTQETAAKEIYDWCSSNGYDIDTLINNVGVGYVGPFTTSNLEISERIMRLNMFPMVRLCHYFLPGMKKHGRAHILNVGSMASFHPIPYKSVYAASKSFVHAFSRGLREELKGTSVTVSALFPPPVPTSPEITKRITDKGKWGQMAMMSAERVAEEAIPMMLAGKYKIVPGIVNKMYYQVIPRLPESVHQKILARVFGYSAKPGAAT